MLENDLFSLGDEDDEVGDEVGEELFAVWSTTCSAVAALWDPTLSILASTKQQ